MGLDSVALLMAYESAFGVDVPDEVAARMRTPADVVDFLHPRLGERPEGAPVCLTARAFRRLRRCAIEGGHGSRGAILPGASIAETLGPDTAERWRTLGRGLGLDGWPRLRSRRRGLGWLGGVERWGEAATELARLNPRRLHPEPWTRTELEDALMRLTEDELGLEPGRFTTTSRYVQDMGID